MLIIFVLKLLFTFSSSPVIEQTVKTKQFRFEIIGGEFFLVYILTF